MDKAEGYAYLRQRLAVEGEPEFPRLVPRRPLGFQVSLLLVLLRKKLAESDAQGENTRIILSREQIVDLVRVFLPESANEVRVFSRPSSTPSGSTSLRRRWPTIKPSRRMQTDPRLSCKGEGVIIKGAGQVEVNRRKVDQTIKKLDVIYGDQATATCLVAAGIKPPTTPERASKHRPSAQPATQATPATAPSGTDQQVDTSAISAESNGKVTVGKLDASPTSTKQKIKTGDIKASGDGQVEVGVINQPASKPEQK